MSTHPVTPPTANVPTLAHTPQPTVATGVPSHLVPESHRGRKEQWGPTQGWVGNSDNPKPGMGVVEGGGAYSGAHRGSSVSADPCPALQCLNTLGLC